jgi:hypothetical protein
VNGDPNQGRNDSKGVSCKNIGGVMDYFQPVVNKWSTCSVEDFQALYDAQVAIRLFCQLKYIQQIHF